MPDQQPAGPVLILTPTGRDAVCAQRLLTQRGIECQVCPSLDTLCDALDDATGAVLVADEALSRAETARLAAYLSRQEPWSDLPFVVLTQPASGRSAHRSQAESHLPELLGNVMFLERPLNALTLVSAVRAALRARQRQRQVRSHLTERMAAAERLATSEAKYRSLFETIDEGFALSEIVRDAGSGKPVDFRFLEVNRVFERQTGLSPDGIVGRLRSEVIPGPYDGILRVYAGVVETGEPARLEHYAAPLDRWYEIRAFPRGGDQFAILYDDITDRKRAEEALRESEARLGLVFEILPVGIGLMDAEGRVVLANPEAHRFIPTGFIPSQDDTRYGRWRAYHPDGRRLERSEYPGARALRGERVLPGIEFVYEHDDGREIWTRIAAVPIRDGEGRMTGALSVITDIDALKQAAEALQESEARFRAFVTASSDVVYRMSSDWTEMRQLAGNGFLSDTAQPSADWMELYIHPDDRPTVRAAIDEAIRAKGLFELEHRVRRADRTLGWTLSRAVPILDRNGEIDEWLGAAKDITSRREAEAALRESEERFRAMADTAPVLIWETDAGGVTFVNGHYLDFFGVDFDTVRGMGWATFLHPDDAEGYVAAYREAFTQRKPYAFECRFRRADGQYRWLRNSGQPVGESRFVGCSLDVTDLQEAQFALRRSEARLKVLVAELQHRTRNLIGVVRAIADRTLASSSSLDEFQDRFCDRLAALARVNGLLSRLEEGDRISFDELLQAELAGHGIVDREGYGSQVVLEGPAGIPLRSSTVQTLALGLHELATNAVKYGALSRPEGRLVVRWSLMEKDDGERHLRVEWRESGVPVSQLPDGQPLRQGYGRELIERALPYQLSAETAYELTPEGAHCTITLPISTRHKELAHA